MHSLCRISKLDPTAVGHVAPRRSDFRPHPWHEVGGPKHYRPLPVIPDPSSLEQDAVRHRPHGWRIVDRNVWLKVGSHKRVRGCDRKTSAVWHVYRYLVCVLYLDGVSIMVAVHESDRPARALGIVIAPGVGDIVTETDKLIVAADHARIYGHEMTKFDFRHAMFSMTRQTLTEAFWNALDSAKSRYDEAEQVMLRHQEFIDAGGDDEEEYEYDADGQRYRLYGKSDSLDYAWREAGDAIEVIREAFVISLFHSWERAARSWTSCHEQGFDGLKKAVIKAGIPFDHKLNTINHLVNFMKHANKQKDEFYRRALRGYVSGKLLRARLTDDHLIDFINVVARSCPERPDWGDKGN